MTIGSGISSNAPGDPTIATDLGVPRSTARGWLGALPSVAVSVDVANLTEPELRQEILKLRRRIEKLAALLRLALALLHTSGFSLSGERLPDGRAKLWILRAADRACECMALRAVLRFLNLSPSGFHAWRGRQTACARRSVVLPSHLTTPLEALRGPGDRGHGDLTRVPARSDRHACHPRAAARDGVSVAIDRGTVSSGSTAGDALGSVYIQPSRR